MARPRNPYFSFKQFLIRQEHSAMKVCTDTCLFGALFSRWAREPQRILDIGTGTGILSLMAAQLFPNAHIDALEVASGACEDARRNFLESRFADRLRLIETPVQEFTPAEQYDLVVCNPPFFEEHLKSSKEEKNQAKHSTSLSKLELAQAIARLMHPNGQGMLLASTSGHESLEKVLNTSGISINQRLLMLNFELEKAFRIIYLVSFNQHKEQDCQLIIYNKEKEYSPEAISLLEPFYASL